MVAAADDGNNPARSSTPARPVSDGSLHDELLQGKEPKPSSSSSSSSSSLLSCCPRLDTAGHVVSESRPCYRCVSYMHSVGIKRVFWTNADGQWEGAKVRELVDSLEDTDGQLGKSVFVTKHEVLLLLGIAAAD